jgi:hypothetical protein
MVSRRHTIKNRKNLGFKEEIVQKFLILLNTVKLIVFKHKNRCYNAYEYMLIVCIISYCFDFCLALICCVSTLYIIVYYILICFY